MRHVGLRDGSPEPTGIHNHVVAVEGDREAIHAVRRRAVEVYS